jgi:putative transposase
VVDYVRIWTEKTGFSKQRLIDWIGIGRGKFHAWSERYGMVNEHNGWIPRDWWLLDSEKEAILRYFMDHPLIGYRSLSYMMLDEDVVAASPSSVYRVLKDADLIGRKKRKQSKKGTGFDQPVQPHEHWHIDISYVNICGTFYYLCSVLDGFSRYVVHWELREQMKELDVEIVLQRAKEAFPTARPRIISDNGPQFVAKDFKAFIRVSGMTHVRTSPYYPQSNGKMERYEGTVKQECIRPKCPGSKEEAERQIAAFVEHYNTKRLHSGIGYIAPKDKLEGRAAAIHAERDRKLAAAREERRLRRQKEQRPAA